MQDETQYRHRAEPSLAAIPERPHKSALKFREQCRNYDFRSRSPVFLTASTSQLDRCYRTAQSRNSRLPVDELKTVANLRCL